MAETTYKLRDGFTVKGDVRAIGERIEAIKRRNATPDSPDGFTTPDEVLADAADPASPLHPCFTWDRTEAARLWNVHEARYLIRSYEVHIVKNDGKPIVVCPANVVVGKVGADRRFVSTESAMGHADQRRQVMDQSIAMLQGLQNRLSKLQGISPRIIQLIEETRRLIADEKDKGKTAKRPAEATVRA